MDARTSTSDPLRIDSVDLPRGRVGLTFCPGKRQRVSLTGHWHRDLDADVAALRAWGASAVVSALDDAELRELEVTGLGAAIEAAGMEWHHVPIPDAGVPDARAEARWFLAGASLRRHVAGGGSVVIHCRGGLGRTGTLTARLLIECGWSTEEAIRAVRAARPGAIETASQEAYVRAVAPLSGPDASLADRVLGCLLGGAVGDALGYEVEFSPLSAIRKRFGAEGIREPVRHEGRLIVSDDTQMTLFTVEGLIRAAFRMGDRGICHVPTVVWNAYLRWLETQGGRPKEVWAAPGWLASVPSLGHQRAPGNTCLSALASGVMGTIEEPINGSKGCGGVMRVAPVGLVPGSGPGAARGTEEAFALASDIAALTHGHPTGHVAAGALAALIAGIVQGRSIGDAAGTALALVRTRPDGVEVSAAMESALALGGDPRGKAVEAVAKLGAGWVAEEALAIGLYAALRGRDYREAVAIAANHDGDSDSTASIAGQIVGAARGLEGLPMEWARRLDVLDPLLTLAHDLWQTSVRAGSFLEIYPPS